MGCSGDSEFIIKMDYKKNNMSTDRENGSGSQMGS
jgi:hypothetical protein